MALPVSNVDLTYVYLNSRSAIQPLKLGTILNAVSSDSLSKIPTGKPGAQFGMGELYCTGELERREVGSLVDKNPHQITVLDAIQPVMLGGQFESVAVRILQKAPRIAKHDEYERVDSVWRNSAATKEIRCHFVCYKVASVPQCLPTESRVHSWNSHYKCPRRLNERPKSRKRRDTRAYIRKQASMR
jgi:hypothetical protein